MVRIMERATTAAVEILIESKAVNGGRCAFVEMLLANEWISRVIKQTTQDGKKGLGK